jgi:hypothetical protein
MKHFKSVVAAFALSTLFVVPMSAFALDLGSAVAASVQVTCKDGSQSKGGQGACSGHGGVNKAAANVSTAVDAKADAKAAKAQAKTDATLAKESAKNTATAAKNSAMSTKDSVKAGAMTAMEPAKSTAAAAKVSAKADLSVKPTGATAKCKDGTFSMAKGHSGACSHHGGVAEFIQ